MKNQRLFWFFLLAAAGLTVLLLVFLIGRYPEALEGGDGKIRLVHGVLVLAFLGGSALIHRRLGPGHTFRNILAWAVIAVVLFTGYGYRYELAAVKNRLMAELIPHEGVEVSGGAVSFRIGKNGHFVVEALVDGVKIRFLVDTGASDVVLSPRDAERLGFDIKALAYTRNYRTANGTVQGAPVRLRQVRIGPIVMGDVRASVNGAPMKRSLLGMSFLGRLSGYDVSREILTLHP